MNSYRYYQMHGRMKEFESNLCPCDGEGCEDCSSPHDYLSDGYHPAFDYGDGFR